MEWNANNCKIRACAKLQMFDMLSPSNILNSMWSCGKPSQWKLVASCMKSIIYEVGFIEKCQQGCGRGE